MSAAADLSIATLDTDRGEVRKRPRPPPIKLDAHGGPEQIVQRVMKFARACHQADEQGIGMREQRYAKLMQFEPAVGEPWDGSSNSQLCDMFAVSLRMEDQIQNSVMSSRPIVNSRAMQEVNRQRERKVDLLLDHQFFVENSGEDLVEALTADFFRDGQYVVLTHWVREFRKIMYIREWDPIPLAENPRIYFKNLLTMAFGKGNHTEVKESDGWDWNVFDQKTELLVRFYTSEDDGVIMQVEGDAEVFAGPCPIRYEYEDVMAPLWACNLQPPGPSNPTGAAHVILVDYPTRDEILRGVESGYYDLVSMDDLEGIEGFRDWSDGDRELARQRLEIRGQGTAYQPQSSEDPDHHQLRRMLCFDTWKGLDVVWWVLEGPKNLLLRARPLTEVCPGLKPTRPIGHARCIVVQGTWRGMGIPELMESSHDLMTTTLNQMVDAAAMEMQPFFKYRQSSNLKPEDVILAPGVGIPCQNPQLDIIFDRINAQATQVGINLLTLSERWQEKLTSVGDLQVGQIPTGKSAALRTASGVQQVLAQGEARPERMLRRFFSGLLQIHRHMYTLDRHFLADEKKFRVVGVARPEEDPLVEINRVSDLGDVHFEFSANVLNSSKVALQSALNEMLTLMGNPLMLQIGVSTPDGIYRVLVDYFRSLGQTPEKYLSEPAPGAKFPPITAPEALTAIMQGLPPQGAPAEGSFEAHIAALQQALSAPGPDGVPLSAALSVAEQEAVVLYLQALQQQALEAQQQFALLQAAQQFGADRQQQPAGVDSGGVKPTAPVVQKNETIDETVPSSGTPQ